jgi:hypothetical protein
MSTGPGKGIGIPVKLLHEAEGHIVSVRSLDTDPRRTRREGAFRRDPGPETTRRFSP